MEVPALQMAQWAQLRDCFQLIVESRWCIGNVVRSCQYHCSSEASSNRTKGLCRFRILSAHSRDSILLLELPGFFLLQIHPSSSIIIMVPSLTNSLSAHTRNAREANALRLSKQQFTTTRGGFNRKREKPLWLSQTPDLHRSKSTPYLKVDTNCSISVVAQHDPKTALPDTKSRSSSSRKHGGPLLRSPKGMKVDIVEKGSIKRFLSQTARFDNGETSPEAG